MPSVTEEVLDIIEKYADKGYYRFVISNIDICVIGKTHRLKIEDISIAEKFQYCHIFLSRYGFLTTSNSSHKYITFLPYNQKLDTLSECQTLHIIPTGRAKICYDKYLASFNKLSIDTSCDIEKYEEIITNKCKEGSSVEITHDFYKQFPSYYNWKLYIEILGYEISDDLRTVEEKLTHEPYYKIHKE